MEAVPRLHMLSFPCRTSTKPTELGDHLKRYIRDHYHENPDSYNNEVTELESLRRSAVNASSDFVGCSTLKKYYCQLHFLTSRFTFDDEGMQISFQWNSAFDHSFSESGNINYEMNSVLYNIAALHTVLGASDPRTTPDGMKISCTHFQCASWAFQVLSQSSKSEGEINSLLMTFMMNLCLGQAQECILEKSMTDNRKPNIIAKVALQVVEYLRLTLKNLDSFKKSNSNAVELVGNKLIKVWQRHCDFKVAYYLAVTLFHQGLHSEEQQKMGERISFFQGAVEKLDEALKLSKNMDKAKQIGETLTFANDVIRGKLTAAQKENEFVYHEKVPPLTSLPEIKGASLVKGISFNFTAKEVAGSDIFGRLVPMEAHQASSLYSEEKAKLLRKVTSEIQEKNEELEIYLASMQLDSFAFEENFDSLPQELVDSCADLNSRDAFQVLKEIMDKINNVYFDLQAKLSETERFIKDEEVKEKEFCLVIGTKKAPNQILNEQKRELAKYKEAHEAAQSSNQALHNAITQHKENILVLSKPLNALVESLPSVAGVESEADKATRMEVQRLLNKVREMQNQRSEFESKLRIELQDDDVTKELVTNQTDRKAFFKEQISKHDQMRSLLDKNMSAQVNILQALSEANAAYGAMRRTINQVKSQRTEIINSLLSSYNAFLNIIEKAEEAKEFYSKLESQINKLNSRVKAFCKVQEEEREEKLLANVKKFGGATTKLDPHFDSKQSGPKLKDFLQAGMGMKGIASDIPPTIDMNSVPKEFPYGSGASVPSSQINPGYMTTPARPNPVGSERNDGTQLHNVVQHSYSTSSQFPPSAPSPGPPYSTSTSYPTSTSYQQAIKSSAVPYSPANTQTPSSAYQYQNYGPQSTAISQSGYTSAQVSSNSTATPTPTSSNQYVSGIPSHSYQPQSFSQPTPQPVKNTTPAAQYYPYGATNNASHLYPSQGTSSASHMYSGQYVGTQTSTSNISQSSYTGPSYSQYQPSVSSSNNSSGNISTSNTSNLSGSYISQAGAHSINLTSSSERQNYSQPSEVKYQPYYNTTSMQYPQTNNPVSTHTSFSTNTMTIGKTDSLSNYPLNSVPSSYTSQVSTTHTSVSPHSDQGYLNKSNSVGPYQAGNTNNYYSNYSFNQTPSHTLSQQTIYSSSQSISVPNSTMHYTQSQNSSAKNIPTYGNTSTTHQNVSQGVTPYNQSYPQNSYASSNGTQYQMPTNSYNVPYSSVYNPTPAATYGYNVASSTPQSNIGSHYQTTQYPVPQSGASQGSYSGPHEVQSSTSAQGVPPSNKETTSPKPSLKQEGISNFDLLSGIDINSSASSQWSPLIPQNTSSTTASTSSSSDSISVTTTIADSSVSLIASEIEKDLKSNGEYSATEVPVSLCNEVKFEPTQIIDLSKLAKPKRSLSVLDPLSNDDALNLLALETERFSKLVQGLDKKSLNGPTNLELKWNELIDCLETKCSSLKVSVGRCYPLKNRFPDNLSFDATRVPLPSTRDDYINASYVQLKSVEDSVPMIITQAPMPNTFSEFWLMVWENQVEIMACLNTDAEVKGQIYFPKDVTDNFESGNFTISLKHIKSGFNDGWVQRTFHLTNNTLKTTKVVLHLQFLNWPPSAMPESPSLFLHFISEVLNLQKQQRNKLKPVVVHCVSGTGRSGVFAVLSSFIKHLQSKGSLADVWNLMIELSQQRRSALQDRTHMLFLYSSALYHAQELLMKRGILTDKATFEEGPREKTHVRHPSADLLSTDLNKMKAKLGLGENQGTETNDLSRSESQSSVVSGGSSASAGATFPNPNASRPASVSPSPTHSALGAGKFGSAELPPNLAASLDPSCLVLNTPNPNKPKKITKENFLNPSGIGNLGPNQGDSDPLSGLDPLWSLKKS